MALIKPIVSTMISNNSKMACPFCPVEFCSRAAIGQACLSTRIIILNATLCSMIRRWVNGTCIKKITTVTALILLSACSWFSRPTEAPKSNSNLPNIILRPVSGGPAKSLGSFLGKPIVMNLWASWCAPCRIELPKIDRLQSIFGDKIHIVSICLDEEPDKAFSQMKRFALMNYPVFGDPDEQIANFLQIKGVPMNYLYSPQGDLVLEVPGLYDWASPAAIEKIQGMLDAPL